MKDDQRVIFRADAVRRYIEGQQKAVFPRFVCPRTFLYLWILLVLLLLAGSFVTWFASGPLSMGEANRLVDSSRTQITSSLWPSIGQAREE